MLSSTNKLLTILACILMLQGCIQNNYNPDIIYPDIVYVSDSKCAEVWDTRDKYGDLYDNEAEQRTAQNQVGVVSHCKKGRKAMDIVALPEGFKTVFLDLGTNDVGRVDIDTFTLHYQMLVDNSDAEIVYCVLPNHVVNGHNSLVYRDAITEICGDHTIDTADYGVMFRAKDGVHLTKKDHDAWAYGLWKIINFGLEASI